MSSAILPAPDEVRDLELLLRAHHPLVAVDSPEEERVRGLVTYVADRLRLPCLTWEAHRGLVSTLGGAPVARTQDPVTCLTHIAHAGREVLYYLSGFTPLLEDAQVAGLLRELHRRFYTHQGALVFAASADSLPPALEPLFTALSLSAPTAEAHHRYISSLLRDLRRRMHVEVALTSEDVNVLLQSIRGLSFYEVRKVITQAVVEDGVLSRDDLGAVLEAKRRIISRSGVLDYYPAEETLGDIAGLDVLKAWLHKRKVAFHEPKRATEYGLDVPKGLLLLGVQGCGKSLSAKAVAAEWSLPLLRLDPSTLYNKYFGESEKNLRRAIQTAEAMAPIVLWIDEIEKAFAGRDGSDGGPSQRIFGTFLTWLNDKKASVFVIATANDVSQLPPELLRKGRFDEIFFVDLPTAKVREAIFSLHLARRGRDPATFALAPLAAETAGFSGAEIEQAVVSALYSALAVERPLDDAMLLAEIRGSRPLSVTMAEKVEALRHWAHGRCVSASSDDA